MKDVYRRPRCTHAALRAARPTAAAYRPQPQPVDLPSRPLLEHHRDWGDRVAARAGAHDRAPVGRAPDTRYWLARLGIAERVEVLTRRVEAGAVQIVETPIEKLVEA
jgi:hypothetical protein